MFKKIIIYNVCVYIILYVQGKLGELLLSLCYQANVGTIAVEVTEARGLRAMDINGLSGQFSLVTVST